MMAPPRLAGAKPLVGVKVRSPKTSELVADHIRKLILRGELEEGDFLPPESQLMETFQVARPTLREAFRILESEQLISVMRGSRKGAQVHLPKVNNVARYAAFVLQAQRTPISDLYEARLIVEPFAAEALARRASPSDAATLRRTVDQMRELLETNDRSAFLAFTSMFHKTLLALHGNHALALLGDLLHELIMSHQAMTGHQDKATDVMFKKDSLAGVKSMDKLMNLIEQGDVRGAGEHWRLHLQKANQRWLVGQENATLLDLLV